MSRQTEILGIMKNFNFHPKVANSVLKTYCERNKIEFLTEGEYEDHLFQYQHDQRALAIIPLILAKLQEFKYVPDYISDAKKKELNDANDALQVDIAEICANNNIGYREIDVFTKNFAGEIGVIIEAAGTRMNNMCAVTIATIAGDVLGQDLKVIDLQKWQENRAHEMTNGK